MLVGLVLLGRVLTPSVPRPARRVLLVAGLVGVGGLVVALIGGYWALFALFFGPQAGAVAVGLLVMLQARAVAAALHGVGLPDRGAFVVGLAATATATGSVAVLLLRQVCRL